MSSKSPSVSVPPSKFKKSNINFQKLFSNFYSHQSVCDFYKSRPSDHNLGHPSDICLDGPSDHNFGYLFRTVQVRA